MINTILEGVTTYEYLENILLKDEKIEAELTNKEIKSIKIQYSSNKTII